MMLLLIVSYIRVKVRPDQGWGGGLASPTRPRAMVSHGGRCPQTQHPLGPGVSSIIEGGTEKHPPYPFDLRVGGVGVQCLSTKDDPLLLLGPLPRQPLRAPENHSVVQSTGGFGPNTHPEVPGWLYEALSGPGVAIQYCRYSLSCPGGN